MIFLDTKSHKNETNENPKTEHEDGRWNNDIYLKQIKVTLSRLRLHKSIPSWLFRLRVCRSWFTISFGRQTVTVRKTGKFWYKGSTCTKRSNINIARVPLKVFLNYMWDSDFVQLQTSWAWTPTAVGQRADDWWVSPSPLIVDVAVPNHIHEPCQHWWKIQASRWWEECTLLLQRVDRSMGAASWHHSHKVCEQVLVQWTFHWKIFWVCARKHSLGLGGHWLEINNAILPWQPCYNIYACKKKTLLQILRKSKENFAERTRETLLSIFGSEGKTLPLTAAPSGRD